ncbi:hypothetical protein FRB97_002819 [Tulasnella sp. 331]|nr:hypothetical protein FRB97_002819 [Tulasnella sp. 331]
MSTESTGKVSPKELEAGNSNIREGPDEQGTVPTEKPAANWRDAEVHEIPENNLWLVFPGLMLAVFLAALDQTIVGTALPTIVRDLGSSSGYAWVGSAYLLAASVCAPLWGVLSDLTGRKPLIYFAIVCFMVGSGLCGAAKSMLWLILSRALQGIGGGAIIQLVQITIADIVSMQERGKYTGLIGATWGVASVIGPLMGGALTEKVSWRWAFYINLPSGGVAAGLLFFLNLNPVQHKTLKQHIADFDFVGLFLIMGAVVCLLVGLQNSETSWSSASTIAPLVVALVLFAFGIVNEFYTKRRPIIPPRTLKTRTTIALVISVFLHGFAFMAGSYYLPIYFQSRGASALGSGILLIPYSLMSSFFAIISGQVIARTGSWRPTLWFGWGVMVLGFGLMIMLDGSSSRVKEVFVQLVAAIGVGCLFVTPMLAIQSAMPLKDMAVATATLGLMRQIGSTVGISAGSAIYLSILRKKLNHLQGYAGANVPNSELINDLAALKSITPESLKAQVIDAYCTSVSAIWIVTTPLVFIGFLIAELSILCEPVLVVRPYSLKRPTARVAGKHGKPEGQADAAVLGAGGGATVAAEQESEKVAPGEVDGVASPDGIEAAAEISAGSTGDSPSGTAIEHDATEDGNKKA